MLCFQILDYFALLPLYTISFSVVAGEKLVVRPEIKEKVGGGGD